jgi:hypothetical protein
LVIKLNGFRQNWEGRRMTGMTMVRESYDKKTLYTYSVHEVCMWMNLNFWESNIHIWHVSRALCEFEKGNFMLYWRLQQDDKREWLKTILQVGTLQTEFEDSMDKMG